VLLRLNGLSSLEAFVLLGAGALLFVCLGVLAFRPSIRTWLGPALAVIGLWAIVAALDVLKDRVSFRNAARHSPEFVIVRNALSLALAAVPLAIVALRQPRIRRGAALALGLTGAILLLLLGWFAVSSLVFESPDHLAVTQIPGAGLLHHFGTVSLGRWIWAVGGLLFAWPALQAWSHRRRGGAAPAAAGLAGFLLGLTATSLAMGVFFWNQADDRHRSYALYVMSLAAYAAPIFTLAEGRVATARWARHAFGLLGAAIAIWMLLGAVGGGFEDGGQAFADHSLSMAFLFLQILSLPVLLLHLAGSAVLRALRRRKPIAQGGGATPRLE
jgi:hypothetical protein